MPAEIFRVGEPDPMDPTAPFAERMPVLLWLLIVFSLPLVVTISLLRTNSMAPDWERPNWAWMMNPARIDLSQTRFLPEGVNYTDWDSARQAFWLQWCRFPDTPSCQTDRQTYEAAVDSEAYARAFEAARGQSLGQRGTSTLSGADLTNANLEEILIANQILEGTWLTNANMRRAVLERVELVARNMAHLDLSEAALIGTEFISTQSVAEALSLYQATVRGSRIQADTLSDVDLRGVVWEDSEISIARLTADFSHGLGGPEGERPSVFDNLDFHRTRLVASRIDFDGAPIAVRQVNWLGVLSGSVQGSDEMLYFFSPTRLPGTALRSVDFTGNTYLPPGAAAEAQAETIRRAWSDMLVNSFGDGSVVLPEGVTPPCQWIAHRLDGASFYGAWRAWLERGGQPWPPLSSLGDYSQSNFARGGGSESFTLADVPALPGMIPDDCDWVGR